MKHFCTRTNSIKEYAEILPTDLTSLLTLQQGRLPWVATAAF